MISFYVILTRAVAESILSGKARKLQSKSWSTLNEKIVYLQLGVQNLGAKETSFERVYFVCIFARRNHIALAFLKRL